MKDTSFTEKSRNKEKEFHSLPIPGMVTPEQRRAKAKETEIANLPDSVPTQFSQDDKEKLALLLGRYEAAKSKRQNYNRIWNDISTYIVPSLNDNFNQEGNLSGGYSQDAITTYIKNSNLVYDATAIISCNKLAGALYSFTNNPALKWYQYDLPITKNAKYHAIRNKKSTKEWLNKRRDTVIQYLNKALASCSNTLYNEAIGYGTASVILKETFKADNPMVGKSVSLETLYLAEDEDGIVNTVCNVVELSAINAVSTFGADRVHKKVLKDSAKKPDEPSRYLHVVAPNKWAILEPPEEKPTGKKKIPSNINKAYVDIYIDLANKIIVHHGGYDEFPYGIARMNVPSNAPYGISPGMMVLPDVKTVNVFEKINIDVGNKAGNPPMQMMVDNYVTPFSMIPAAINLYTDPSGMATPVQTVGNVNIMENALERKKQAIKEGFYNDLLQPAKGNTTYEVQEEQMLQMKLMAPWQGGFENELYTPLIRRAEGILERAGNILPEIPDDVKELYGNDMPPLVIDHTSPLSLAQKSQIVQAVESVVGFAGGLAQLGGMDSIKIPETIQFYAEVKGIPMDLIRDIQEIKQIQDARNKQQAEVQQKQMMTEEAKQAELLSKASKDTDGLQGMQQLMGAAAGAQGA